MIDYLKLVKSWLDSNPNEVVTILVVNINNLPPTSYQSIYQQAGMDTVSFAPPQSSLSKDQWPTLGSMIDSGKRVVTFIDNQANFASVPFIIDEFSNMWESPFDVTDPSFPCAVNRTTGQFETQLGTINHFLDQVITIAGISSPAPNKGQLPTTNGVSGPGSLGAEVQTCVSLHGAPPNFLLVDFYEFGGGSVFQVAAQANGVQFTPSAIASPVASGASSSTTSTPLNMAIDMVFSARRVAAWASVLCCIAIGALVTL